MHNLPVLAGGSNVCTLLMHPDDAGRLGIVQGGDARVSTTTGSVVAPVVITDDVRPGVVCMPHGWGHARPDAWGATARERGGANVNELVGSADIDLLSGTSVLAGIPVDVAPA
jgi:anaerobic selenocysteine-containing dehydrogenase